MVGGGVLEEGLGEEERGERESLESWSAEAVDLIPPLPTWRGYSRLWLPSFEDEERQGKQEEMRVKAEEPTEKLWAQRRDGTRGHSTTPQPSLTAFATTWSPSDPPSTTASTAPRTADYAPSASSSPPHSAKSTPPSAPESAPAPTISSPPHPQRKQNAPS